MKLSRFYITLFTWCMLFTLFMGSTHSDDSACKTSEIKETKTKPIFQGGQTKEDIAPSQNDFNIAISSRDIMALKQMQKNNFTIGKERFISIISSMKVGEGWGNWDVPESEIMTLGGGAGSIWKKDLKMLELILPIRFQETTTNSEDTYVPWEDQQKCEIYCRQVASILKFLAASRDSTNFKYCLVVFQNELWRLSDGHKNEISYQIGARLKDKMIALSWEEALSRSEIAESERAIAEQKRIEEARKRIEEDRKRIQEKQRLIQEEQKTTRNAERERIQEEQKAYKEKKSRELEAERERKIKERYGNNN